jgi:hypothetical protein
MKFYIQQTALDRLARTGHKMDSTGKTMAQISIEPAKGFVEVALTVPRCKTCPMFRKPNPPVAYGWKCTRLSAEFYVLPDGTDYCSHHPDAKP